MKKRVLVSFAGLLFFLAFTVYAEPDSRNINNGTLIPTPNAKYVDQPKTVILDDGSWLCMMTVGGQAESKPDVHTIAVKSFDKGKSWTDPVRCGKPYGVPVKASNGRIYCIRPQWFRYSDDQGISFSKLYDIKRSLQIIGPKNSGWSVTMPVVLQNKVIIPWAFTGIMHPPRKTEIFFLVSHNILTESLPKQIQWQLYPKDTNGLKGPEWHKPKHRSEEPHMVVLNNGNYYCLWRTDQGHIASSLSKDTCKTWTKPEYVCFADGRLIKHPLACSSMWKCSNGRYLLWIHNHNHKTLAKKGIEYNPYSDRNPAWICGGVEKDGKILWSQPEILLYSDDHSEKSGRISYPELLETTDRYIIFESQKTKARFHDINPKILDAVWHQFESTNKVVSGLRMAYRPSDLIDQKNIPVFKNLSRNGGFSFEIVLKTPKKWQELTLFDTSINDPHFKGIKVELTDAGSVRLMIGDGNNKAYLDTDPGKLKTNSTHHLIFIVDGGPHIMTSVVDGKLCDGGEHRQYGWEYFADFTDEGPTKIVSNINAQKIWEPTKQIKKTVELIRIYDRYLLTSEAISNYRNYMHNN